MAGRNRFMNPYANMQNAGGNHQAQTAQGIIQEGRKSYQQVIDSKINTNKAPDAFAKTVRPITPPVQTVQQPKPITPKR